MRVIILIILCAIISSCGVFKRTERRIDRIEQSSVVEMSKDVHKGVVESSSDLSTSKEQTNTKEREQRDIDSQTTVEADEINIDKDGNLSARGNARLTSNKKDKGTIEKEGVKMVDASSLSETNKESTEIDKQKGRQEVKYSDVNKESVSKPSSKGIITGVIAVLLVIIVCAWWFFGIGKKKN